MSNLTKTKLREKLKKKLTAINNIYISKDLGEYIVDKLIKDDKLEEADYFIKRMIKREVK